MLAISGPKPDENMEMLKNKDIVITGLQPWNFSLGSNIANLARTLAKNNRVLFINYAFDRATLLRKRHDPRVKEFQQKRRNGTLQIEQADEQLWIFTPGTILESINQIGPAWIFNPLNRINGHRFAAQINKAIGHLRFTDFILFCDSDFYRSIHLPELIRPDFFIYYIRDNMVAAPYYRKHGPRLESEIIGKADAVVTNSGFLAEYASGYTPRAHFVGQGCDLELFHPSNASPLPEEVSLLCTRFAHIVGYTGALKSSRLDIELLVQLAEKMTNTGFMLVGPEDDQFRNHTKLHALPNILFMGPRKEQELPSWVNLFDVAINPQRVNEVTIGNYPRKIDEYLALGKPVVATATPAMEYFGDYVYLASGAADYEAKIRKALAENTPELSEARIRYARTHSWERNVEEIDRVASIYSAGKQTKR